MVKIRDLIRTITDNGALLTAMEPAGPQAGPPGLIQEGLIRTGPAAGGRKSAQGAPDREHPGDARMVFRMEPRLPDMKWQYGRPAQRVQNTSVQNAFNSAKNSLMRHPLFAKTFGAQAGGTAPSAVGFTVAGCSALGILIIALVGIASTWLPGMTIAISILALVLGGSSIMAWKGTSMLGRVKRFRKYVDGLKGRTYHCSVKGAVRAYREK